MCEYENSSLGPETIRSNCRIVVVLAVQLTLTVTTHPAVVMDDATRNVSATCRDRFGTVDVDTFRQRACTQCFVYLFAGVGGLLRSSENLTHLVLLNGSAVAERYVVDSVDPESLDRVCRQFARDMGGSGGCTRWIQCCTEADACCQQQRQRAGRRQMTSAVSAPASCAATWDGFSCWARTPAGSVVRQQCPEYMTLADKFLHGTLVPV